MQYLRIFGIMLMLTAAQSVLAAEPVSGYKAVGENFVPIAPIPSGAGGGLATSGNLAQYINTLFQLSLAVGAALAALYIAIGGFEYIMAEATEAKRDGRLRIIHALSGLGVLLLVTIILYVINPDVLCLNVFEQDGKCSGI